MKVRIDVDVPNLGQKIKEARKANGTSLTRLAADANMTVANWYAIEAEQIKSLPIETLKKIEQVLNTDFGVLTND